MGTRAITNKANKSNLRIKLGQSMYRKMVALARTMVLKMTGNANFVTASPSLASVTTAADNLATSMQYLGQKRNRGSKAQLLQAKDDYVVLRDLVLQLISYVKNTASAAALPDTNDYNNIIVSSGAGLQTRGNRGIVNRMQVARRVAQVNDGINNSYDPRLNWEKPKGLIKGKPAKSYNIYFISPLDIVNPRKLVATTTATTWSIPPSTINGPEQRDYEIVPFNNLGEGQARRVTVLISGK